MFTVTVKITAIAGTASENVAYPARDNAFKLSKCVVTLKVQTSFVHFFVQTCV